MNTTTHHTIRDVIAGDDWLKDFADLTGEERYQRYEKRLRAGLDTTGALNAEAWGTRRIRDVGAPLAPQDDTADVIDLRDPQSAMRQRWAAHDGLTAEERAAKAKAADGGADEVIDLSNVGASR